MILVFDENTKEGIDQQNKLNGLMDALLQKINTIGTFNIRQVNVSAMVKKDKSLPFLFPLIHTLCNPSGKGIYNNLNQANYILSFPLFVNKENDTYRWVVETKDVQYNVFAEESPNINRISFIQTKDYMVSKRNAENASIKIVSDAFKIKESVAEMKNDIIRDMQNYVKMVDNALDFYNLLAILEKRDCAMTLNDELVQSCISLFKSNPKLLKVITVLGGNEFQEKILPELKKIGLEMKMGEPMSLLDEIHQEIVDIPYFSQCNENLKSDLFLYTLKLQNGNDFLSSLIFKQKLEEQLSDNPTEKKHKL